MLALSVTTVTRETRGLPSSPCLLAAGGGDATAAKQLGARSLATCNCLTGAAAALSASLSLAPVVQRQLKLRRRVKSNRQPPAAGRLAARKSGAAGGLRASSRRGAWLGAAEWGEWGKIPGQVPHGTARVLSLQHPTVKKG